MADASASRARAADAARSDSRLLSSSGPPSRPPSTQPPSSPALSGPPSGPPSRPPSSPALSACGDRGRPASSCGPQCGPPPSPAFSAGRRSPLGTTTSECTSSYNSDDELSQHPHPSAHELPAGLIFVCADDDLISRIVVGKFIERARADRERSLVLGDAFAEVAALPETVAKLAAAHGDARVIVHLDQQMVWDEESGTCAVFGTHLCRRLRDEVGFTGVIIVVSADDAPEAQIEYIDAGADVCFGKGKASLDALLPRLAEVYHERFPAALPHGVLESGGEESDDEGDGGAESGSERLSAGGDGGGGDGYNYVDSDSSDSFNRGHSGGGSSELRRRPLPPAKPEANFPSAAASVGEWLRLINMRAHEETLEAAGITNVAQLPALTDAQLKAAGIKIVGHRKRLLTAAKAFGGA